MFIFAKNNRQSIYKNMKNRVYYGEYSLKHWIELILKQNIILPDYQRYFVWHEKKVQNLINTFKKKQFVPPITIGAFRQDEVAQNLILDGQQRLTSILLAYLGYFPDADHFKKHNEAFINENDDDDDDKIELDNIFEWTFKSLTNRGRNKVAILNNLPQGNYKQVTYNVDEDFFSNNFLGFSYLVPDCKDNEQQQKYYSSVFRNININSQSLLPQESRASLYYLNHNLSDFFDPQFCKNIKIKNSSNESKLDFVRYLSLLFQYEKDKNIAKIARGYKPIMEKYYELFIFSVVEKNYTKIFESFLNVFPEGQFKTEYNKLEESIINLNLNKKEFNSIIDLDIIFFGLIHVIIFNKKEVNFNKLDSLNYEINNQIAQIKNDNTHRRSPSALKHLRRRIEISINIYNKFTL